MDISEVAVRFKKFAVNECKDSSQLYEYLSLKISKSEEILTLCLEAREGQPIPNVLFGAVHYLLFKGKDHQLQAYYPSLTKFPKKITDETFVCFKDFCNLYRNEIILLLKDKLVQTNEVRRCAYLYPVFSLIYEKTNKPLSLIEIGTSAGLQLLWDEYSYTYGTDKTYGNKNSSVLITSEIKGSNLPKLPSESPPVASKTGLDLHVVDLRNAEDYLWLKALMWPEHSERLALFEDAAKCYQENPVELIEGDGIALLKDVIKTVPQDTTLCVFHTHVANQMPEELKYKLLDQMKEIGSKRDVFHLYNNMWDLKLHLDYYIDGVEYNEIIGETDGHGKWFEWNVERKSTKK